VAEPDEDDVEVGGGAALLSLQQVQEHIDQLLTFFRQKDLPLQLGSFAPLVQALRVNAFDTVYRVGFLGASNIGKSFMLNALLRCTAYDAIEYAQPAFRARQQQHGAAAPKLEYIARLNQLGRSIKGEITHIRLADQVQPAAAPAVAAAAAAVPAASAVIAAELFTQAISYATTFNEALQTTFNHRAAPQPRSFDSSTAWLLPSDTSVNPTTAATIRMHFGRTFHMVVRYFTQEQMRTMAFSWLENQQRNEDPIVQAREWWRSFIGTAPYSAKKHPAKNASELQLCAEAMKYAGRCEVYEGLGHTRAGLPGAHLFDVDREWIRQQLASVMRDPLRSHGMHTLDVFVPSRLLEGGCELLDIPGSGDSHLTEMVRKQVQDCHQLFLLTQQSPDHNTSLSDAIRASGFLQNLIQNDPNRIRDLHVVGYLERVNGASVLSSDPNVIKKRDTQLASLQDSTAEWLHTYFPEHADVLVARIPVYFAEPVTFLTLLLERVRGELDEDTLLKKQQDSNILRIINAISSIPRQRAQVALAALLELAEAPAAHAASAAAAGPSSAAPAAAVASVAASASSSNAVASAGRVVGLLPRVLSMLESELQLVQSNVVQDVPVELANTARSVGSNKKLFLQNLNNAVMGAGVQVVRKEWEQHFDDAARVVLADDEVGFHAAVEQAKEAGVARFHEVGRKRLTAKNIAVSLGPAHRGNRPPLRLRELLYQRFIEHPLQSAAIIKGLRSHMEEHLQQHTAQLQQSVISRLLQQLGANESLQRHGSVQRAVQRAIAAAQEEVRAVLATLFSDALTVENLYTLCDKAFRAHITDWLQEQNFQSRFSHASSIDKLRDEVEAAIPGLFASDEDDDFKDAFFRVLSAAAERKLKTAFWAIWDQTKTKSAVRVIATRLLHELANLVSGGSAAYALAQQQRSANLASMLKNLRQWAADAADMLRHDPSEQEVELLYSLILHSSTFSQLHTFVSAQAPELAALVSAARKQLRKRSAKALRPSVHHYLRFRSSTLTAEQKKKRADFRSALCALQKHGQAAARGDQQLQTLNSRGGLPSVAADRTLSSFASTLRDQWALEVADVPSDGDCLFTALAHQLRWAADGPLEDLTKLEDAAFSPRMLRRLAVQHMQTLFGGVADFAAMYGSDLVSYSERMLRDGTWGGEPELIALANVLQVQILVWMPNGDRPVLFTPMFKGALPPAHLWATLHIGAVSAADQPGQSINHFVSLVQMSPFQSKQQ